MTNSDQDNRFNMWRAIVAVAHADHDVSSEEQSYLEKIITTMHSRSFIKDEQKAQLDQDLKQSPDVTEALNAIEDPKYRGQVLYFARMLAHKDGVVCDNEDALLKRLHINATGDVDIEAIKQQAREATAAKMTEHEIQMDSKRETKGIIGLVDSLLVSLGIDLMD